MKPMSVPVHAPLDVYHLCVEEVNDALERSAYLSNASHIQSAYAAFDSASSTAGWFGLQRASRGNSGAIIAGDLTKGHLVQLYERYMVKTSGAARAVYDKLLTSAGGHCPYCGGLGHASTLDHYLPKAYFPVHSVNPKNLVPCCKDCQSGNLGAFASTLGEQSLHPYFDQTHLFSERWLVADLQNTNPLALLFRCSPPAHWPSVDQGRVNSHFVNFGLKTRFAIEAGRELARVVRNRRGTLRVLSPEDYCAYLSDQANDPALPTNGWQRTTYHALASTSWFCEADFTGPEWD